MMNAGHVPDSEAHADSDVVVRCRKLTKRFRTLTAVESLDLDLRIGDVFGFLGPNGAGKSTTLRMMVGLIRPTSGSVSVFGHSVWDEHARAMQSVGAMIEAPAFYKYLSGRENLQLIGAADRKRSDREFDEVLDMVGLLSRASDKVKNYSQGMRQRLGVALALLGNPKLVLLDEPTNGLDPEGVKEMRDLVINLRQRGDLAIFLSSHILHEVEQVCTRVGVVNKGRMVLSGDVEELLSRGSEYELRVDSTTKAAEIASELGWNVLQSVENSTLKVNSKNECSADLNNALVREGVKVYQIVPKKTSLEELYMEIMAEKHD